jgi:hypothetical protein
LSFRRQNRDYAGFLQPSSYNDIRDQISASNLSNSRNQAERALFPEFKTKAWTPVAVF